MVNDETFAQPGHRCRLDWGRRGAFAAAKRGDALVIVDVLSFSTAVATAVERGAEIHPCRWEANASDVARSLGAEHAVARGDVPEKGRYSLSPGTMATIPKHTRLVLASPNGATCAQLGRDVSQLFVAALVNATAVGAAVGELLRGSDLAVTLIACGERWKEDSEDGRLRVAIEDYLGAGAVLSAIAAEKSPEARVCEAAFRASKLELAEILAGCGSGLELCERGFEDDVLRAAELDCYDSVPVLRKGWIAGQV